MKRAGEIGYIKGVKDISKIRVLPDGNHEVLDTVSYATEAECEFNYGLIEGEESAPWPIQSRGDAARLGKDKFYTGRTCKRGHVSQRYVSSGQCVACMAARSKGFKDDRAAAARGLVPFNTMVHPDDLQTAQVLIENMNRARGL
jgi:hypothetical protein